MIPIRVTITRQGVGFSATAWRGILTRGWTLVGIFWHRFILPKHFTRKGIIEYGIKPRKPSYERVKYRLFGHVDPLVFTGEMKDQVTKIRDVRADAKGARVFLHGPKHLWPYRKDLNQPDKAAELSRVSETDAAQLGAELDKHIMEAVRLREERTFQPIGQGEGMFGVGHQGEVSDAIA